jgi:heme A synthase
LACFVAVWAFLVVCIGGVVKSKEAGLTIADPVIFSCQPEWLWVENLNVEYGHRIVAGCLGCLALALAICLLARDSRRSVRRAAVWAVVLVVAQAALGALTVKYFAHAPTSVPHAALGQVFLCLVAGLAVVTSRRWHAMPPLTREAGRPSLARLSDACLVALFIQFLLGAALRHDDQGRAMLQGHMGSFALHLLAHILGAMAVAFFMSRMLMRIFRAHRGQSGIIGPARAMMVLLALQLALGAAAAALKLTTLGQESTPRERVWVATSHVAVAALLLVINTVLSLRARRFVAPGGISESAGSGGQPGVAGAAA